MVVDVVYAKDFVGIISPTIHQVKTLIEDVATLEAALEDEPLTCERYLEIASDLYHWHLPVLADVGVIEWDERSQTVRYRPHALLETWGNRIRRDELDAR